MKLRDLAELLGLICFVVFSYFVWAPLAIGVAGVILFFGSHAYQPPKPLGREVRIMEEPK